MPWWAIIFFIILVCVFASLGDDDGPSGNDSNMNSYF